MVSTVTPGSDDKSDNLKSSFELFKDKVVESKFEIIDSKIPFINLGHIKVYDKISFLDEINNKAFIKMRKGYVEGLSESYGILVATIDGFFIPKNMADYHYFDTKQLESRLATAKTKKSKTSLSFLIREKKNAKRIYQSLRRGSSIEEISESTGLRSVVVKNYLLKLKRAGLVLSNDEGVYSINQFRDYILLELGKVY